MVVDLIRSRAAFEAEIWVLRQQINVLRQTAPKKLPLSAIDRLIFVGLYRFFPKVCDALAIVKPDTIVRWHRAGFRLYWRRKSRPRGGRPAVPLVTAPHPGHSRAGGGAVHSINKGLMHRNNFLIFDHLVSAAEHECGMVRALSHTTFANRLSVRGNRN
jgi:hypothetical protein